MDFLKALGMGQQLLDALKLLATIVQANAVANEQTHASNLALLDATQKQTELFVAAAEIGRNETKVV